MNKKILILFSIGLLLFLTFSCAGSQQKKEVQQKSFEAYYSLGVRYLSDGEYQKALIEFRKAESFQPKDPQIHNAMGLVYYYMQKFNEAEKEYKKAVSIKKDYSEAYVNLGTILAQQGKYKDAILQFRKALKNPFYPTPAFSLHNIGLCYQGLGNKEKAETAMQEAIQNDPNFIRAYFDLGKIYYQNNQMDQAIHVLSKAIEKHTKLEGDTVNDLSLGHLHYWLALSYFKNGNAKSAVEHFQEVTRLSGKSQLSEEAWKYLDLIE